MCSGALVLVKLRNFEPKDLLELMRIELSSFPTDTFDEHIFFQLYESCRDLFLVAEAEGKIVGYSVTCIEWEGDTLMGHVHSIAVDPALRRRGVGRALMEETFRRLRSLGVSEVKLEVSVNNEAGLRFWQSLGFEPVGIKKEYYADGSDALVMRMKL
jgi:ribosomal-protein-alanine acetyltransferase|uniref:Ribosomal-protein-alanine N-acetyltransferase n=1 Tax=Thermofilum pendens TaxID=2269 RepID=A0A7C3SKG8_THEPE